MSEEQRANIAAAITADLEGGQATEQQAPAPPAIEAKAAPEVKAAPAQPAADNQPVERPQTIRAKVKGEEVEVNLYDERGQINPLVVEAVQKLRDYTQGKMTLAEQRRELEVQRAQWQAEMAAAKASAGASKIELPPDDPYAQSIRAVDERLTAYEQARAAEMRALEEQRVAVSIAKLESDIERAAETYKLDEAEREIVGNKLLQMVSAGDSTANFDRAAQAYVAWRTARDEKVAEEKLKAWQEKHRVASERGGGAAPAAPPPEKILTPGSRGFADAIFDEISALTRR